MDKTIAITQFIKREAIQMGFSACGVAKVTTATSEEPFFNKWLAANHQAGMAYMENNLALRLNPQGLIEGAKTIISVALNYYPPQRQPEGAPRVAYYAYGRDYHKVIKKKLRVLWQRICQYCEAEGIETPQAREFTDTAPLLERYWAWQAGLGFIGKNTQLIIPGKGSYFFLGEIVSTLSLVPDMPLANHCGSCTRCLEACPTQALIAPYELDAKRCLSYLTIEHRGSIPDDLACLMGDRMYGCDTCQLVCPHNRFAQATVEKEFYPSNKLLALDGLQLNDFTLSAYQEVFKQSAAKRAKYEGMVRNAKIWLMNNKDK